MTDDKSLNDGILVIMRQCWDLHSHLKDGDLKKYADGLRKRIQFGVSNDALDSYLSDVQPNRLEIPWTRAYREIVDQSIALVKSSARAKVSGLAFSSTA
ncbi:MAG: hypothetical protein WDN46_22530 [Methylocella sp.]